MLFQNKSANSAMKNEDICPLRKRKKIRNLKKQPQIRELIAFIQQAL